MVHFADEKRELDFMRRDNFKWKDVEGTREEKEYITKKKYKAESTVNLVVGGAGGDSGGGSGGAGGGGSGGWWCWW